MRHRRGLSPRTAHAVAQLTSQDVDDLLLSMPFLAPILPVPQTAGHGMGHTSHRTPRRQSSKGRLSPRGSTVKAGLQTPRGSFQQGLSSARLSDATPGGKVPSNAAPVVPSGAPAEAFRLAVAEVELATKAWLQVLDSSSGQSQEDGLAGSGAAKGASAASLQAMAFARACTEVAHLHEGRQLRAILQQLHIPVLSVIGDLMDHVVELSAVGGSATARPSLHFFRFLKFLCECKHLAAILRHHRYLNAKRPGGFNSSVHYRSAGEDPGSVGQCAAREDDQPTEELEMDDIRATYEYLQEEAVDLSQAEISSSRSPRTEPTTLVTAAMVQAFAERFDLSLAAVLPAEYLTTDKTPSNRSVSTPPPAQSLLDPLSGQDPFAASLRSAGSPRGAGSPPPKPQPSLLPNMASAEISLETFAEQVRSRDEGEGTSCTFGDVDLVGIRREESFGSAGRSLSQHGALSRVASQKVSTLSPLRLGAISAPLVQEHAHTRDALARSASGMHTTGGGTASVANAEKNYSTLLTLQPFATFQESHSRLSTLQLPPLVYTKYEEHKRKKKEMERERNAREARLREEYLYGPPRPKPKKKTIDEECVMLLREATELAEALPDSEIYDIQRVTEKIQVAQRERRKHELKEANRYAFLLGNSVASSESKTAPVVMSHAVRKATAQEILSMLHRCPQDSVLGTQACARQEQRLRGMNGLDTTASSIARQRQSKDLRNKTSGEITPTTDY